MRIRRLLVACLLATPIGALPAPSHAAGGGALQFTLTVDCWGCSGEHNGTLNGTFAGLVNTAPVTGTVSATMTVASAAAVGGGIPGVCTVNASASGSFTGAITDTFSLTYVFPGTIVITNSASGSVWVGYMTATNINCLGQTVFVGAAGGAGASF
jgi:hypothetical protein